MGTPGLPSPTVVGSNLVIAQVLVNGVWGAMVVDTGAPYTFINPALVPGANLPTMGVAKANITFGAKKTDFTVDNVPVYSDTADPLPFTGIVGANLLRQFVVTLNYRDQNLLVGGQSMPTDVETPGGQLAFVLQGGGRSRLSMTDPTVVTIPPTRIPVTVDIEGKPHPFVLDTGASDVIARTTLFNNLVSDGRANLPATSIFTVYGMMMGTLTRAREITVAGQQVMNPIVLNVGDDLLDQLGMEVGYPVDGLLGGSFLRDFLVTIDYPKRTLRLQRYTSAPALDPLRRVGLTLDDDTVGPHVYAVGSVYPGSDAALQHVMKTDEIISIDGNKLDQLDQFTVEELLLGPIGTTHDIEFGITVAPANQNAILKLRVDDLLPNPA